MHDHDDVIDLWVWHCICSGIATPELARALISLDIIAQAIPTKYNYRYVGIDCHSVSV